MCGMTTEKFIEVFVCAYPVATLCVTGSCTRALAFEIVCLKGDHRDENEHFRLVRHMQNPTKRWPSNCDESVGGRQHKVWSEI